MIQVTTTYEVTEFPSSIIWFDEHGILYSISKKVNQQQIEETKQVIEFIKQHSKNEKICMLIDVTHAGETTREVREYAAAELPKITKAIAMISDSIMGKMVANLFFNLKFQPYPVKMFNDEKAAIKWLMEKL
ncbi:MAG: STAS/SEC14 domain-containing protein [Chitinophagaceae bacterium]|nr:STAS/SEC14 domain-containing protein [Chitinophagaceae bacterium]